MVLEVVVVMMKTLMALPDVPTRPYLTIFVQKSASSTDVRAYFAKYGQFPESMEFAT